MSTKPLFTSWSPIVTNPQSVNNPAVQVFDSELVIGLQLWFGESTPGDAWDLTLRLYVELSDQQEAKAGLLALGRDPDQFSWVPIEQYQDIKVTRPGGTADWCVSVGDNIVSPGWVMTIMQNVPGRIRGEIVQTRGNRRLLLYRLLCR